MRHDVHFLLKLTGIFWIKLSSCLSVSAFSIKFQFEQEKLIFPKFQWYHQVRFDLLSEISNHYYHHHRPIYLHMKLNMLLNKETKPVLFVPMSLVLRDKTVYLLYQTAFFKSLLDSINFFLEFLTGLFIYSEGNCSCDILNQINLSNLVSWAEVPYQRGLE